MLARCRVTERVSGSRVKCCQPEAARAAASSPGVGKRRCVREVTGWLRDVRGVESIVADAGTGTVVLSGTMTVADVLAAFGGSKYDPRVLDSDAGDAPGVDAGDVLGAAGLRGLAQPMREPLERYVVLEELLAAGAPVGSHWVADRQSGPLLMRYSPDVLAPRIVPREAIAPAFEMVT